VGNIENGDNENLEFQDDLPVIISKDEMNLAEFPFTLLSKRANPGQKTIEVAQSIRDQNGRVIKQEWVVTGSDKYGLPLAIDEDVYIALMQLYKENDFKDRRVHFSRYQMLHIMSKETSKRGYDRLEDAFNRLVSVTIVSKNAFWDNKAKMYVSQAFHLFESYRLYDERASGTVDSQQSLPLSHIVMSDFLFDSVKYGYIKNIDTTFYFSLDTPISKRLYRYLDKKRYQKLRFEIDLLKLAALLPIQDKYPSQIKRRLEKPHNELIKKGFLKSFSYEKVGASGEEKVVYVFPRDSLKGSKWKLGNGFDKEVRVDFDKPELKLRQELVKRGITEVVAGKLMSDYPANQIETQIAIFDRLLLSKSSLLEKNPPGFLRKSIEDNYQPPKEYLDYQNRKDREEKEKDRQERWLKHREKLIKRDIADWDTIPPSERVGGRLDFWIAGEKLNSRWPTEEQIEAMRQELIDSLPKTEDEKWEHLCRNYPEKPLDEFE